MNNDTEYPEWLRKAAAKGGAKSKRKLSKKDARAMAWKASSDRERTEKQKASQGKPKSTSTKRRS